MKLLSQIGRLCVILAALGAASCDSGPSKQELQDQRDREFRETTSRLHTLCYYHDDLGSLESVEACIELSRVDPRYDLIVLSDRGLTELPNSFHGLEKLKHLSLDKNELRRLPSSIALLSGLKKLTLHQNQFQELPEAVLELSNLEILSLGINPLDALPDTIHKLQNLEALGLFGLKNGISLPEELARLPSLKIIEFESTFLGKLPTLIVKLPAIEFLHLHGTSIREVPKEIGSLTQLKGLVLSNNKIKQLPHEIGNLRSLSYLNVRDNELKTIPDSIAALPYFRNRIDDHSGVIGGSLTTFLEWDSAHESDSNLAPRRSGLDLSNNSIEHLSDQFCRVEHLNIHSNVLDSRDFYEICNGASSNE